MRNLALSAFALATAVLGASGAQAAPSCPARTPTAITKAADGSLKCQATIAREGTKFISTKMKVLAACQLKQPSGTCPTTKDAEKITKAATKAKEKIAKDCSDNAVQAGLTSSYAAGSDDQVISSCMLSQHNVVAGLVNARTTGIANLDLEYNYDFDPGPGTLFLPVETEWPGTGKARATCLKEVSKSGWQFVDKALKAANSCVAKQMKDGVATDLAPICVGSFDGGGAFVPPSDPKTGDKQTKLFAKTADKLAKKCGEAETLGHIATLFGCPGSETVADLEACIVCNGYAAVMDAAEQQYSETGTFVANAPAALQTAVSALSPGDKLLLGSGDYAEEVELTTSNVKLVGCGGATNERPRIVPPVPEVEKKGIRGANLNDILFQSISVFKQTEDGIRIALANNIVYRDIVGDGDRISRYAVFPVTSNNVTVELCTVRNVSDAGIYIGQSSGVIARWNDVRGSVAGTEIENCGNAQVYGNYATGNTAGLLVFKDGSLPVQLSQCHEVHHNLFEVNNEPNYGSGTVAGVPRGTGMLVISNDTTPFHHNVMRNSDTFGMTFTTSDVGGLPVPAEPMLELNFIYDNVAYGNAGNPDLANLPLPVQSDFTYLPSSASGNCQSNNIVETSVGGLTQPACTLPPPAFGTCPAPSVP